MNIREYLRILDKKGNSCPENPFETWSIKTFKTDDVIYEVLQLKEYSVEREYERKDNYLIIEYLLFAIYSNVTGNQQRITIKNITNDSNYYKNVKRIGLLFGEKDVNKYIDKLGSEFTVDISNILETVIYCYTRYVDYLNYCVYNSKVRDSTNPRFRWIHHAAYFLSIKYNGKYDSFIAYYKRVIKELTNSITVVPFKSSIYGHVTSRIDSRMVSARYDLFDSNCLFDIDSCAVSKHRILSSLKKLEIIAKLINQERTYERVRNLVYINPTMGMIARLNI